MLDAAASTDAKIEGLPPGAVVRPIKSKPKIEGLPEGAVVRPIKAKADTTEKKRDRTPSIDQRSQKFFENHPITREAALGAASGLGIPESQHPVWDMVKGFVSNANPLPQTDDEKTFM